MIMIISKMTNKSRNLNLSESPASGGLLLLCSKTCHNLKLDAGIHTETAQRHHLDLRFNSCCIFDTQFIMCPQKSLL